MARKKKPRKSVDSQSNAIPSADPATQEKDTPKTSTVPPTMTATSSDTLEENATFKDKSHSAPVSGDQPMFCTTQKASSDDAVQCSSTQFSAKYSFYSSKEAESVGEYSCLWF